jgi:hypothetical protein
MSYRILAAAIGMCGVMGGAAHAQEANLDMSSMWAANMAFENNFYQWAWQGSVELARQIPDDQPLPFNAMTISAANQEAARAGEAYIGSLQANSNRAIGAVERWDIGSVLHDWFFAPEYGGGTTYQLPYDTSSYTIENGTFVPGYQQGGDNYYAWE